MAAFAARGFHGATTAAIARDAAMAPATLFTYFPTKEALIEAARHEATMRLTMFVPAGAYRPEEPLHSRLRHLWLGLAERAGAHRDAFAFWELYWATPGLSRPPGVLPLPSLQHVDRVLDLLRGGPPAEGRGLRDLFVVQWQSAVRWGLSQSAWAPPSLRRADAAAQVFEGWWALTGLPRDSPYPADFRPEAP